MINKQLIKDRVEINSSIWRLKETIDKLELQLSWLPFYAEYIETKKILSDKEKELSKKEQEIFVNMTDENIDKVKDWDTIYAVVESSKPSISISSDYDYPEEAFEQKMISKTKMLALYKEYEAKWEPFEWVTLTYKKSLKIF